MDCEEVTMKEAASQCAANPDWNFIVMAVMGAVMFVAFMWAITR